MGQHHEAIERTEVGGKPSMPGCFESAKQFSPLPFGAKAVTPGVLNQIRIEEVAHWIECRTRPGDLNIPAPTDKATRLHVVVASAVSPSRPVAPDGFRDAAAAENKHAPLHRWVPWIAGFSSSFVADVFDHYLGEATEATVLDPFAGVGTTLVEAQLRGWRSVGFEVNAYAALACHAKLAAADIDPDALEDAIEGYRKKVGELEALADSDKLNGHRPKSQSPDGFNTRMPFYPDKVLPKVLFTLDYADGLPPELRELFRLAFASVMVSFSNYTYEPSLGSRPGAGKPLLDNAPVVETVGDEA